MVQLCLSSYDDFPAFRRGHTVLKAALPPKEEYVFMIQMSDIQKQLYKKFMDSVQDAAMNGWVNNNPLKAFAVCCKVLKSFALVMSSLCNIIFTFFLLSFFSFFL